MLDRFAEGRAFSETIDKALDALVDAVRGGDEETIDERRAEICTLVVHIATLAGVHGMTAAQQPDFRSGRVH